MPTLYVENVPDDLYEALRERSRQAHRSIAAEVLALLEQNIPTEKELKSRRQIVQRLARLHSKNRSPKRFPSAEEMLREDRTR
jgi:plasmid stability protein